MNNNIVAPQVAIMGPINVKYQETPSFWIHLNSQKLKTRASFTQTAPNDEITTLQNTE